VLGWAMGKLGLSRLTMARTCKKPSPSPLYYTLCLSTKPTSSFLFRDSQVGVPKLPKLGLPQLWGPITLCADLRPRWGLKKSCSPHRTLFNGMWHATCTQGNRVDYWLLMVGSQIANLILNLFFGHNLCFRCPNGWCKPILDIYVSISFQWYK